MTLKTCDGARLAHRYSLQTGDLEICELGRHARIRTGDLYHVKVAL